MSDAKLKEPTGYATVRAHYDVEGMPSSYDFDWHGGDLCSLTFGLIDNADKKIIVMERGGVRDLIPEDTIWLGPYVLKVLSVDLEQKIVDCIRERPKETEEIEHAR